MKERGKGGTGRKRAGEPKEHDCLKRKGAVGERRTGGEECDEKANLNRRKGRERVRIIERAGTNTGMVTGGNGSEGQIVSSWPREQLQVG